MRSFLIRDKVTGHYFAHPNGLVADMQCARVYSTLPAARRGMRCPKARLMGRWGGPVPVWEIVEVEIQWKEIGVHA